MPYFSNSSNTPTLIKINTSILEWLLSIYFIFIISFMTSVVSFSAPSNKNNVNSPMYINAIAPQFVSIKAGSFLMGSPENEPTRYHNAETQHSVTLTRDFEMQITEVTQMQWVTVMGYNPSRFQSKSACPEDYTEINGIPICSNHPVENISWNNVKAFFQQLNTMAQDGYTYRLPTEAEWEYAARGGQPTAFSFGSNVADLPHFAWFNENADNSSHHVASKNPNAYGLYDMHGNIYEYVQDWWTLEYPTTPQIDPQGPWGGLNRVIRGGSWYSISHIARSAARNNVQPDEQAPYLGFRMVRIH